MDAFSLATLPQPPARRGAKTLLAQKEKGLVDLIPRQSMGFVLEGAAAADPALEVLEQSLPLRFCQLQPRITVTVFPHFPEAGGLHPDALLLLPRRTGPAEGPLAASSVPVQPGLVLISRHPPCGMIVLPQCLPKKD